MKSSKIIFLITIIFFFFISGKNKDHIVIGLKPMYISKDVIKTVSFLSPQPIINSGKIYLYQNYVFINELYKGVHVISNIDPYNPQKIGFISILGNVDISVKSNYLFADNYRDLIVIDINNILNPTVIKRVSNVYSNLEQMYPKNFSGYFECVDTSKGYVSGWVSTELINPKCLINENN